jgi:hypothetical protein
MPFGVLFGLIVTAVMFPFLIAGLWLFWIIWMSGLVLELRSRTFGLGRMRRCSPYRFFFGNSKPAGLNDKRNATEGEGDTAIAI